MAKNELGDNLGHLGQLGQAGHLAIRGTVPPSHPLRARDSGTVQMRVRRPEQAIQKAIADHLRARAHPDVYWFHPANGGARTAIEGAILKACGVRAGTPDLILIRRGRTYALELKAANGRLSPAQVQAHKEMRSAGVEVEVATGIDEALAALERWEMLRGTTQ
jgi:VRR-NUC domain